jgi:hypothetical protein
VPAVLKRGAVEDRFEPGMWKGSVTIYVSCPKCGLIAALDHQVADDGTVTPSLVCPEDEGGCGWHDTVRLDSWPP